VTNGQQVHNLRFLEDLGCKLLACINLLIPSAKEHAMSTNKYAAPIWSLFRIVVGLLFTLSGMVTVFGILGAEGGKQAAPLGAWPGWWAGLIQVVCGLLVLTGLLTRPAAILASGSMAYAYFTVHQPQALLPSQNGGASAALYCWSFLAIAVLGAGPWSLDALLRRSPAEPATAEASTAPATT
jgi:putative oxidoreductase